MWAPGRFGPGIPGQRDRLIPAIEEALLASNSQRLVRVRSQTEILANSYNEQLRVYKETAAQRQRETLSALMQYLGD